MPTTVLMVVSPFTMRPRNLCREKFFNKWMKRELTMPGLFCCGSFFLDQSTCSCTTPSIPVTPKQLSNSKKRLQAIYYSHNRCRFEIFFAALCTSLQVAMLRDTTRTSGLRCARNVFFIASRRTVTSNLLPLTRYWALTHLKRLKKSDWTTKKPSRRPDDDFETQCLPCS